jgi:hypothetical protein
MADYLDGKNKYAGVALWSWSQLNFQFLQCTPPSAIRLKEAIDLWRLTVLMPSENTVLMGLKSVPTNSKKSLKLDVLCVVMWPSMVIECRESAYCYSHCDGKSREIPVPSRKCLSQRWLLSLVPGYKAQPICLPNGEETLNLNKGWRGWASCIVYTPRSHLVSCPPMFRMGRCPPPCPRWSRYCGERWWGGKGIHPVFPVNGFKSQMCQQHTETSIEVCGLLWWVFLLQSLHEEVSNYRWQEWTKCHSYHPVVHTTSGCWLRMFLNFFN